ncbi:MAG: polysaccharide pyruvyl transferase CsaB, partial [Cyanobacteria bacterium P01_F01_bin.42]
MRLHALIMAAAEGCRGFALSYDPKVTRLMEEISLPGYELATLPLDSGQIATAWQAALAAPPTCDADVIQDQIRRSLEHQTLLKQIFTASV